jgi:hypothetical protein
VHDQERDRKVEAIASVGDDVKELGHKVNDKAGYKRLQNEEAIERDGKNNQKCRDNMWFELTVNWNLHNDVEMPIVRHIGEGFPEWGPRRQLLSAVDTIAKPQTAEIIFEPLFVHVHVDLPKVFH